MTRGEAEGVGHVVSLWMPRQGGRAKMNGTIRTKLVIGLAFVLCLSIVMTASGIFGLVSYRNVIANLDRALNVAPHKTTLVERVSELFAPLRILVDRNTSLARRQNAAGLQQQQFDVALKNALEEFETFWRRTENLPTREMISGRRAVTQPILNGMAVRFRELLNAKHLLGDLDKRESAIHVLRNAIADLVLDANQLPDPAVGLRRELDHARQVYRYSWNTLLATSALGLVIFLGLIWYGWVAIFNPLKKLHKGAIRVAHGDFDYRVGINTNDEMSELAEAFNQMTDRFQETTEDLDNQVRQRVAQLVRSERLAGVGFLAAGVAHEINNPLSAIQMAADSLQDRSENLERVMDPADAAVVKSYLRMIQSESDRCRHITSRLLDFARSQDNARMRTDLCAIIREVRDMVQLLSKHRSKQILFERPEACYAEVNSSEIKQVFLNLVANALEAMESSGTLRISLSELTDQVVVMFQDDGCGMTPEVRDNIFEPFYTHKQGGQGTGLGLSISHRIVHDHGGSIEATSPGPGGGSTFFVRLPRRAQAQGTAA